MSQEKVCGGWQSAWEHSSAYFMHSTVKTLKIRTLEESDSDMMCTKHTNVLPIVMLSNLANLIINLFKIVKFESEYSFHKYVFLNNVVQSQWHKISFGFFPLNKVALNYWTV